MLGAASFKTPESWTEQKHMWKTSGFWRWWQWCVEYTIFNEQAARQTPHWAFQNHCLITPSGCPHDNKNKKILTLRLSNLSSLPKVRAWTDACPSTDSQTSINDKICCPYWWTWERQVLSKSKLLFSEWLWQVTYLYCSELISTSVLDIILQRYIDQLELA